MRNLSRDLIYALRALGRAPLLVVVTVVSLALGIGAATSVYTVANGLLFRAPGEYHEPERLGPSIPAKTTALPTAGSRSPTMKASSRRCRRFRAQRRRGSTA